MFCFFCNFACFVKSTRKTVLPLFQHPQNRTPETIEIENGQVVLYKHFYSTEDADKLFGALMKLVPWQQEQITLFGKTHPVPRLSSWHGDPKVSYVYSGIVHEPNPWTEPLAAIRLDVEKELGEQFNSMLANLYRDGNDRVGWHADDETNLGWNPFIASLSFGVTRRFDLRHKKDKTKRLQLHLNHGSLLVMKGTLQHNWQHQIPVQKKITEPRINLTFRQTGIRE
ncbi:MAG: alpha-ketoglutarate-dependent dioxygenase AlkB [Okeania sp. SIO3C4]|nr:alpha-ketoglutarate-dependent dioxygenase AlkB [Okeania sp. SIO3C4]